MAWLNLKDDIAETFSLLVVPDRRELQFGDSFIPAKLSNARYESETKRYLARLKSNADRRRERRAQLTPAELEATRAAERERNRRRREYFAAYEQAKKVAA